MRITGWPWHVALKTTFKEELCRWPMGRKLSEEHKRKITGQPRKVPVLAPDDDHEFAVCGLRVVEWPEEEVEPDRPEVGRRLWEIFTRR